MKGAPNSTVNSANSTKAHIAALALLDRAFLATTDEELAAAIDALPEDHLDALKRIASIREDTDDASGDLVADVRTAIHKGRVNGDMQRLAVVLADHCLADCIEALGDKADLPSEDDLTAALPALVETHGLGLVRVMLASSVVGEAAASATIVYLLKTDETVKLPPLEMKPIAPLLPAKVDDEARLALKAQRKERKRQEQHEARLRREQVARAKNRTD